MTSSTFTIVPSGAFSLRESALFGFGQRSPCYDGFLRIAFCLDGAGYSRQVGAVLRQDARGVHVAVSGSDDVGAVREQVARVLSLDHDARGYEAVASRDPVVARLLEVAPGLRPPLFYSPYEAAVWCVLSARRPGVQMARVRAALSARHGAVLDLAGEALAALPTPEQLLRVEAFPGVPPEKLERMQAIARAALRGELDVDRLRSMGPQEALLDVQRHKGIGPFGAALIVIRATGFTDVLPAEEPRALELVRTLYGLPRTPTPAEFERIAQPWAPWRTWVAVLVRAAGARLLASAA